MRDFSTMKKQITKSEYFRDVNAMFTFEPWMLGAGDGWYGLSAAFMHAGIEDDMNVRVSAADQRKLFGRVVFGKQCVRLNSRTGAFETVHSVAFGQDWHVETHYPSHYYVVDGVWNQRQNVVY
jgi:hypothetical protein